MSFWCSGIISKIFLDDASKNWIFGPKTQFLAPKRTILSNLGQKKPAEGPNIVLPQIKSYPEIAWDMGTTFQCWRSLQKFKMEAYGLTFKKRFLGKNENFPPKNGPKTCPGASRANLSAQKSPYLTHFKYFLE